MSTTLYTIHAKTDCGEREAQIFRFKKYPSTVNDGTTS